MQFQKMILLVSVVIAGCATLNNADLAQNATTMLKTSFQEKGQAKLDRLEQDDVQKVCSATEKAPLSKDAAEKIEKAQLATIVYPADGKFIGDWKAGEKIAQSGVGKQYNDDPKRAAGGNCYACHQISQKEISYGTLGPSLYQYGKLRGNAEPIVKYTWGKIYNPQAYVACSNMPRFGHKNILTEEQIRDVVALLLDPESPVNK